MATALGEDSSSVARERPSSLLCDGSSVCRHCGGWQCETETRARRHSDTRRPATAVAWTQLPHRSCPVSPRVRPATAIGWEAGAKKSCDDWKDKIKNVNVLGVHEESDDSCESNDEDCEEGIQKLLDILRSKKKEKSKFKLLMSALIQCSDFINRVGEDNMTPLHYAVLVMDLIEYRVGDHVTTQRCSTAHLFAFKIRVARAPLRLLLLEKPYYVTWRGDVFLCELVENGEELCVKALVVFGADINVKNIFHQTPLDIANHNQRHHLVPLLISIGCLSGSELSSAPPTPKSSSSSPSCVPATRHMSASRSSTTSSSHSPSSLYSTTLGDEEAWLGEGQRDRCGSDISEQMEEHMQRRLEMTLSLNQDEALALALQKQEIARFRSKCRCQTPSPQTSRPFISRTRWQGRGKAQRVLSLDGGGVRGLIQIDILMELEKHTKQKITDLFDWIVGTSTGAILAMLLVYRQVSLRYLRNLYFRLKEEVFSKGRVGFCYDTNKLEELLKEEFGTDMRMSDVQHPKILIGAVNKSNIPLKLHFFNNCFDDEFSHQLVWKVARYTTAAPMFFTECDNYVDGGVLANNPCNHALTKIQTFYHAKKEPFSIASMVSIGSGIYPLQKLGSVDFHVFLRLKFSGMFQKAQSLITMLTSAIGESEALADRCKESCDLQNIAFYRFNPHLPEKIDSGVTDNVKLLEMMMASRIYMKTQKSQLQQLLPLLQQHTS